MARATGRIFKALNLFNGAIYRITEKKLEKHRHKWEVIEDDAVEKVVKKTTAK